MENKENIEKKENINQMTKNTLSVNKITQNTLFNGTIWKQYNSSQLNQEVHIVWYDMARRLWKIAFPNPHHIIENSKTAAN